MWPRLSARSDSSSWGVRTTSPTTRGALARRRGTRPSASCPSTRSWRMPRRGTASWPSSSRRAMKTCWSKACLFVRILSLLCHFVRVFTNPPLRALHREKRFRDNRVLKTSLFETVISRSILYAIWGRKLDNRKVQIPFCLMVLILISFNIFLYIISLWKRMVREMH